MNVTADDRPDVPDHLGAPFDWMSLPHERLYEMVHDKLNVEVGTSVAADWARLGDGLTDLGDELADLARDTAAAWEGDTAELAASSVTALAHWARHTGDTATEVAGCVTMAVDNAARARDAMPKPLEPTPAAGARAFAGGGFDSAVTLFADHSTSLDRAHERHTEAARVMDQFQSASRDVYRTVPRFTAPDPAKRPKRPDHAEPVTLPVTEPVTSTTSAAAAGPASGDGGSSRGAVSGDAPRAGGGVAGGAAGGIAGGGSGRGDLAPSGGPARGAAPGGMGALPMGAGMGGGRDEDYEHKGLGFLEEPGFWECGDRDLVVSAAVIGELPSHG